MSYKGVLLFLGVILCQSCFGEEMSPLIDYPMTAQPPYFWGHATNGLQPLLRIERGGSDWAVEIFYLARTNFPGNVWLRVTNRAGSKIKVLDQNGEERPLKEPSALSAWKLPVETKVSDVMRGVERPRRVLQWWKTDFTNSVAGKLHSATTFGLENLYGGPFTNDYILLLAPLLYKVDTNGETAHLVEFPSLSLKLLTNGNVIPLESLPKMNKP
jgi:hypothetical protein